MDNLQAAPGTFCTSKAGLAAGTTSTYSTTGATLYCIRGKAYSAAAAANAATSTTDANTGLAFPAQAIGTGSVYVFGYNAAGAVRVVQGQVVTLDASGAFAIAPQFPVIPDTVCAFGYLLVQLAPATAAVPAVAAWTFGANNQAAVTGVTYQRQDLMTIPDRPQIT